jgi:hypothetical protein
MQFFDLLQSLSLFLPDNPSAVWLFTDLDEVNAIYPIVDSALRQRPTYKLIIAAPQHQVMELRRRLPHEQIVALTPQPQRIRPAQYSGAALQILGAKYHHLSVALSRSLRVEEDFDAQSVLRLLPASALPKAKSDDGIPEPYLVRVLAGSSIAQLDDLSLQLDTPQHILCLGNGPSSEDSRLQSTFHDCLFRVNWTWRSRGLYLNPSLVFTADAGLPFGSPGPIVAYPSRTQGLPIIRRHCLLLRPPRKGYLFADEIIPALRDRRELIAPSNGAIMIAVAAALKPERIIIAGIDLYSHDQGRYPGDKDAVDGYSRDHSRTIDVEFIRSALSSYKGKLEILSEGLTQELSTAKA